MKVTVLHSFDHNGPYVKGQETDRFDPDTARRLEAKGLVRIGEPEQKPVLKKAPRKTKSAG